MVGDELYMAGENGAVRITQFNPTATVLQIKENFTDSHTVHNTSLSLSILQLYLATRKFPSKKKAISLGCAVLCQKIFSFVNTV